MYYARSVHLVKQVVSPSSADVLYNAKTWCASPILVEGFNMAEVSILRLSFLFSIVSFLLLLFTRTSYFIRLVPVGRMRKCQTADSRPSSYTTLHYLPLQVPKDRVQVPVRTCSIIRTVSPQLQRRLFLPDLDLVLAAPLVLFCHSHE